MAMWTSVSLFRSFTETNVYGTGSVKMRKTRSKIPVDIRIFLQCMRRHTGQLGRHDGPTWLPLVLSPMHTPAKLSGRHFVGSCYWWAVQKWLNRSRRRLGCTPMGAQGTTFQMGVLPLEGTVGETYAGPLQVYALWMYSVFSEEPCSRPQRALCIVRPRRPCNKRVYSPPRGEAMRLFAKFTLYTCIVTYWKRKRAKENMLNWIIL